MTTIHVMKTPSGAFVPATESDADAARRFKVGRVQKVEITEMRNGAYFRKWWLLAKFAFDMWSERLPRQEYRGKPVQARFKKFRQDLTILAGHYETVWNIKGEMRLEADSLSWASMSEEEFDDLYKKSIKAILETVLPDAGLTEEAVRHTVETLLCEFA